MNRARPQAPCVGGCTGESVFVCYWYRRDTGWFARAVVMGRARAGPHHMKILRAAGLFEDQQRGRSKYGRLRRDAIDERFPGLLNGVLPNV